MVTIRSSPGMYPESTLRSVVLPLLVPPLTKTFALAITQAFRNPNALSLQLPRRIRSCMSKGPRWNLRMFSSGPSIATGGMAAWTREPSGSRASQMGL